MAESRPDVPESVVELLETMLAKRPEDRFQNPAELLSALIAVTEQLGIVYPQISLPAGWSARPRDTTWLLRHAPWLVPAVLLLLTVLVLGIVWHLGQQPVEFPELRIETSKSQSTTERQAAAPNNQTTPPAIIEPSATQ